MKLTGEQYMQACRERLDAARRLIEVAEGLDRGDRAPYLVASGYLAGVAVESLFSAFLSARKAPFDEKHDILKLAKNSGFLGGVPRKHQDIYGAHISTFWGRWRNSHRYCSASVLLADLRRSGIDWDLEGDDASRLLYNARQLCDAAYEIWARGERQWKALRSK